MDFRRIAAAWNRFWFAPISPTPIALFRILFGFLVILHGILLAPDLLLWYGEGSAVSSETALQMFAKPHVNLFALLPPGNEFIFAFFIFSMLAALALTLGLWTRGSTVIVLLWLLSVYSRGWMVTNAADIFLHIAAFYLIFSPAGEALSLDRLWRILRGQESGPPAPRAPWAQRMIQVQLAMVYFSSFLWKNQSSQWADGTAVYYISRLEAFRRFPVPYLFEHLWTVQLLTWGSVVLDFLLATFIWIIEFRYTLLAAGILYHLFMDYSINVQLLQAPFLAAYATFVEPEHLSRLMNALRAWMKERFGPPVPVFYDGTCEACIRSVRALEVLDLLRRFSLVSFRSPTEVAAYREFGPEQARRAVGELLLRLPNGTWLGGFSAFRWIAWRLPLCWLAAPFLHLPGADIVGNRLYAWVSRNRYRFLGVHCAGTACLPSAR